MRHRIFLAAAGVALLATGGCGDAAPTSGDVQAAVASSAPPGGMAMGDDAGMSSEHMDMEHASEEHDAMGEHDASEEHADDHDESFAFGAPAAAADADRTIAVDTVEEGGFHYDPGTITVREGETVTFRVHNVGEAVHEFVLGDREVQQEHEAEMRAMRSEDGMMMHDDANAVSLQPGETKELTWTFTSTGELIFGCHEPGHYEAGMRGDLMVGA